MNVSLVININVSINSENLVNIGPVFFETVCVICQFLHSFWPSCLRKLTINPLKLRGYYTEEIFTRCSRIIAAVNVRIYISILQFVLERHSKGGLWIISNDPRKLIGYHSNVSLATVRRMSV